MSDYIPDDLLANVLLSLPIESLLRCRCVSKSWRTLIDSPEFTKMHFKTSLGTRFDEPKIVALSDQGTFYTLHFDSKYSFPRAKQLNYPLNHADSKIHMVGSCNGLLCLTNSNEDIVLWNPWTQNHWEIPSPPIEYSIGSQVSFRLGFGYEHVNDDYKVVSLMRLSNIFEENAYQDEVYVYSLKLNSWRRIGDFPWKFPEHEPDVGAFANGALHWIVKRMEWDVVNLIVSFDLGDEEFRQMHCPRYQDGVFQQHLRVFNGNLCLLSYYYSDWRHHVDLSVMTECGVEKLWNTLESIVMPYDIRSFWNFTPLIYLKKDRELVLQIERDKLVVYNPWMRSFYNVSIDGSAAGTSSRASCVCLGSLVRPFGEGSFDKR